MKVLTCLSLPDLTIQLTFQPDPWKRQKNSYYDNIIDIVTVTESSNDEITFFIFLYNPVYGTSSLHNGGKVAAA